jgi:hypothetical protein
MYLNVCPGQQQIPHHHLLPHLDGQQQRGQLLRVSCLFKSSCQQIETIFNYSEHWK